jgi:hypothetical protein
MVHILIFKTNIKFKKDLKKLEAHLNTHETISTWNLDREDIDRVLRIESSSDITKDIINIVKLAGYHCEEFTDN